MISSFKKIYHILNPKQRKACLKLLILILIGAGFDALSVGMVIPALNLVADGSFYISESPFSFVKEIGTDHQLLFMAALLTTVFLVRGVFMVFISWVREKDIASIRAEFSSRLYLAYLAKEYDAHLEQNSSVLVRNVITEAVKCSNLLNVSFIFLSDFLIVLALLCLVLLVSPLESVIALALFGLAWAVFYYLFGKRLVQWGRIRQASDGLRLQHARQGLGAIKEVKLLGRETEFVKDYNRHNRASAQMVQYHSVVTGLPRILFETIAVLAIFLFIIIHIVLLEQSPTNLVSKIGLFAVAAFRILPSVNRLASGYNTLKFGRAVIEVIHQGLGSTTPLVAPSLSLDDSTFPFQRIISLRGISFQYPSSELPVLSNASLSVRKGETIGIVGESGTGKSTLVNLLLGLLSPQAGEILVDGTNIQENLRGWQRCIGYVPQTVFLCDDTLARNVAFGLPESEIDEGRVHRVIEEANLTDLVTGSLLGIQMPLGENGTKLSGGQRQRVGIARALYRNPELLVLDEATSSLDKKAESQILETLAAIHKAKTILIISHRESTLSICDRVFTLTKGIIIEVGSKLSFSSTQKGC